MAATITDLANGTSITSNTTVATGATVTAAVGDWLVVFAASSNDGANGAASQTGVVDSDAVNVYVQRALINYDPAAAGAGATLGVYTCQVAQALSGDTITVNHSGNTDQKAVQVYRVVPAAGEAVQYIAADGTGSTGNDTTHSAPTVSVTSGDIIFGAAAIETDDAVTGDADADSGSWSSILTRLADGGADASTMSCSSQHKTVTATANQAWACTTATARDSARTYLILRSGIVSRADAAPVQISDAVQTILATLAIADTPLAAVIAEVVAIVVPVARADALPLALSEAAAIDAETPTAPAGADLTVEGRTVFDDVLDEIGELVGTVDRLMVTGVHYLEAVAEDVTAFTFADNCSLVVAESAALAVTLRTAEAFAVVIAEAMAAAVTPDRLTDALAVVLAEAVTAGVTLDAYADALAVVIDEAARATPTVTVADALPVGLTETLGTLAVTLAVAEAYGVPVTEALGTLTVSTAAGDLPAVAIADAVRLAVATAAADAVAVQIGAETVTITLGQLAFAVQESLGLTLDELATLVVTARLAETYGLGIAEAAQVAVAVPRLADSLALTIAEATAFLQALAVSVADALAVRISDAVPVAVQVALRAADALPLVITEAVPTLAVFLTPSDPVAVALFDALATTAVRLRADDTTVLTLDELARLAVALAAAEVLVVQLVEGQPTIVEGALTLPLPKVLVATIQSYLPAQGLAPAASGWWPHALAGTLRHEVTLG